MGARKDGFEKFKVKDLKTIKDGAKLYEKNLNNKDFLIIFKDFDIYTKKDKIKYVEIQCRKQNFMHLTGIQYIQEDLRNDGFLEDNDYKIEYAAHFYELILEERLNINYCYYKADGTTQLKLDILLQALNFPFNATMIGDYNQSRLKLYANKICGGTTTAIGFINSKVGIFPNTVLKTNVRDVTERPLPIIMICSKNKNEEKYSNITRKGKLYYKVKIPSNIQKLLDLN